MTSSHLSPTPWYKQFWPWFLIALPATVVVAGLTTVYIAFTNADSLVRDNYYRDGLAINKELDLDKKAVELGVSANIQFDTVTGEVIVDLRGSDPVPQKLALQLLHPLEQNRDMTLDLVQIGQNRYRSDMQVVPTHRYYLRLSPADGALWRLNGEIDFEQHLSVNIQPTG